MERESFEDEEVAAILNREYVAVKVDREERPDVDHLYMTFCQAMTGHGGWPLTVLMTPDKKPFFAGTYFPKKGRMGMPGITDILERVAELWKTDRKDLIQAGERTAAAVLNKNLAASPGELSPDWPDRAFELMERYFDNIYGGLGGAPKFPTPHNLTFLLRYGKARGKERAAEMVEKTLEQIYKGGIFDHIGFGFSRYSTDKKWLVPHFEKMLYDNALLAIAYLEAYQVTKRSLYREVAENIFAYVLRDMTSPEGAFYSAEDADSEGVEGKFYVWTPDEVATVLGEEHGKLYCRLYDITEQGNFEGKSIPNLIGIDLAEIFQPERRTLIGECREKLFRAREKRVHPYKDDKVLTSWNALMIAALAMGGRILGNDGYVAAAERAVKFIFEHLERGDGRLLARYRDGEAAYPAYLEDYAFLVWALIELYETTYSPAHLAKAVDINARMIGLFWDQEKGGLFMTGEDGEELLARSKEIYDGAVPSGNSVAALNFLRLAGLTGDYRLENKARELFQAFGGDIADNPLAYAYLMQAYLYSLVPTRQVVIVAEQPVNGAGLMLDLLRDRFLPYTESLFVSPETAGLAKTVPFVRKYRTVNGRATAYICENHACRAPVTELEAFEQELNLN